MGSKLEYNVKALLDLGKFSFHKEKFYESLSFYAKAVQLSPIEASLEEALNSVDIAADARKLLALGLATKFPLTHAGNRRLEWLKKVATAPSTPVKAPVIIVAGGCSSEVEVQMNTYQNLLLDAFHSFRGTIISGGTTAGISGLIGKVQQKYLDSIFSIGYVPKDKTNSVDTRYREIRLTEGETFSPIEPLQYWIDIVSSGIETSEVKLLGINGGQISAIEYRIALALGAKVGIVRGSGSEADKLLADSDWNDSPKLFSLLNKFSSVSAFIMA
jgi:hypothetical protein